MSLVALYYYFSRREGFADCPELRNTIGLMPFESDMLTRAPCLSYAVDYLPDVSAVVNWAQMKAAGLRGPLVLFVTRTDNGLRAVLMAPDHMKTGAPAPNLHAIGVNHRWVARFVYDNFRLTVRDPNWSFCTGTVPGCGASMPLCGCVGGRCRTVNRYSSDKFERAKITDFWAVYELRGGLRRDILPAGIDLKEGEVVVSNNGAYAMYIKNDGLYFNGYRVVAAAGLHHIVIEDTDFVMYTADDKPLAKTPIIKGGESPYALVLEGDGLHVYDRYGKSATSPDTKAMTADVPKNEVASATTGAAGAADDGEWTPERDFAERMQQLLDWLSKN